MEHRSTSGYSCPLTLQLIGPRSPSEVSALLSYDARDPYAVRITFSSVRAGGKDTVTWLIGRELLRAGLDQPTGMGTSGWGQERRGVGSCSSTYARLPARR
jgi:hypothetical protein